jgi:GTPase SAR1 family protein
VTNLYDHVRRVKDTRQIPFVIVGTKSDLVNEREVTYEKGKEVATGLGVPFFEASALTGDGVERVFHELARLVVSEKKKDSKGDKKERKKRCIIL